MKRDAYEIYRHLLHTIRDNRGLSSDAPAEPAPPPRRSMPWHERVVPIGELLTSPPTKRPGVTRRIVQAPPPPAPPSQRPVRTKPVEMPADLPRAPLPL